MALTLRYAVKALLTLLALFFADSLEVEENPRDQNRKNPVLSQPWALGNVFSHFLP